MKGSSSGYGHNEFLIFFLHTSVHSPFLYPRLNLLVVVKTVVSLPVLKIKLIKSLHFSHRTYRNDSLRFFTTERRWGPNLPGFIDPPNVIPHLNQNSSMNPRKGIGITLISPRPLSLINFGNNDSKQGSYDRQSALHLGKKKSL